MDSTGDGSGSPAPKKPKTTVKSLQNKLKAMEENVKSHQDAIQSLKDLPERFNQLLEALSSNNDNGNHPEVPNNTNKEVDDDPISNLIDKSKVDDESSHQSEVEHEMIDILNAMQPTEELGPELNKDVCNSVTKLFTQKYPKPSMDKIKEQNRLPSNCKVIGVPKINKEIWSLLPTRNKQMDFSNQSLQQGLSTAAILAAKMAEKVFETKDTISKTLREDLLKSSMEINSVLGTVMQEFNQKRRMDIRPILNKDFSGICAESNPTTDWLFGDNLPDQLKNSRVTANVVKSTMKSFSYKPNRFSPYNSRGSFKSLNWRGSFQSRGGTQNYRRGSFPRRGQRNHYQQQSQFQQNQFPQSQ